MPSVLLDGGARADGGAAAGDDDDDGSDDDDDDDGGARGSHDDDDNDDSGSCGSHDSNAASDDDGNYDAPTPGKRLKRDDDDDAPVPSRRVNRAGDLAELELGDSCSWSKCRCDMMLSVYRSHDASTSDYVYHVAQFCEDNGVSQGRYCWPCILEIARGNARRFNGTNPARKLKDFMALARCPSAHDAGHCRPQHEHLEDALMA